MRLNLPKDHLSPAQVSMALRCGEQYRRRYIEGEKAPPGLSMLRGRGVHKGADLRHRTRMETGKELSKRALVECAVEAFDHEIKTADELRLLDEEKAKGKAVAVDEARDTTVRLAGVFRKQVVPEIPQPVASEHEIRIPSSNGVELMGIIDLAHNWDDEIFVEDLKTGTRRWDENRVRTDLQAVWYAMLWRYATGKYPASVGIRQLLDLKRARSEFVSAVIGDAQVKALLATINTVALAISAGVFQPAPAGSWYCSPRWCGWYHSCKYVA